MTGGREKRGRREENEGSYFKCGGSSEKMVGEGVTGGRRKRKKRK